MHFLCFPLLSLDFQLCKQLHGLFVHCLLELERKKNKKHMYDMKYSS